MIKSLAIALIILVWVSNCAYADRDQSFAICFQGAEEGFQELQLPDRIYSRIVGFPGIGIATPEATEAALKENPFPETRYFVPDAMINLAGTVGVRYLIWLKVEKADTQKSAHTFIPYVFRSQHRKYILGVRMYVVDSFVGETVAAEYFEANRRGPAVMSYLDYDENDPGLVQNYTSVRAKFVEMAEEISDKIAEEIMKVAHNR
ncbi:MAG: hypothetical protein ABIK83_01495 [Candidatus Zixiibacteriota bacterium]